MEIASTSPPPVPFGDYLLLERLGTGGMAEVWRAKRLCGEGLGQIVAVKRILPFLATDEEFVSMFFDEGRLSLQLLHAHIAQTFELGQSGSEPFLAMEYIPGKSLGDLVEFCRRAGQPVPIPLACYCIARMCEGLDYAHRKQDGTGQELNIVHRGLSPQDVLVSYAGEVKVIDFGIAKAVGRMTQTWPGIIKGKVGYMSPEQINGLPVDARADVFATGVCLYELITGQRLFEGDSVFESIEKARRVLVAPPSTHNRRIPQELERIVLRAMAPDLNERYRFASDLGEDLQRYLTQRGGGFDRQELERYMRSTFAGDFQRELRRKQEDARIALPWSYDI